MALSSHLGSCLKFSLAQDLVLLHINYSHLLPAAFQGLHHLTRLSCPSPTLCLLVCCALASTLTIQTQPLFMWPAPGLGVREGVGVGVGETDNGIDEPRILL